MNENLNLCKILKGHEGETFYCELLKEVELRSIIDNKITVGNGKLSLVIPDCHHEYLFPSKDQRDWNKWVEEQKPKGPKTWSEIKGQNIYKFKICKDLIELENKASIITPIEKSVVALLKIHQLIEVGYGGNPSFKEKNKICNNLYEIDINYENHFYVDRESLATNHITFHTKEQAEEFLRYPENVQLLKDYFMI